MIVRKRPVNKTPVKVYHLKGDELAKAVVGCMLTCLEQVRFECEPIDDMPTDGFLIVSDEAIDELYIDGHRVIRVPRTWATLVKTGEFVAKYLQQNLQDKQPSL